MEASLRCRLTVIAILFLLFLAVPILEIWVIVQVGEAIGIVPTLALLIADSLLGVWLIRSQGRAVWARFQLALDEGRVPAREVLDGTLVIVGGALQIAPGFVTDAIGLVLVLPPTRSVVRRLIVRRLTRHPATRIVWGVGRRAASRRPPRPPADFEGTATEIEPDRPQLP
jgi:UPF0716 protein FxsA